MAGVEDMRGLWQIGAIIIVLLALVLGIPAMVWGPGYLRHRNEARLRAEGLPAVATILTLEDTGNRFNDTPEIIIRLEVTAEGRPAWQASFRRVMDVPDVQFFTPGRRIPVRFDPQRPEQVAFAP